MLQSGSNRKYIIRFGPQYVTNNCSVRILSLYCSMDSLIGKIWVEVNWNFSFVHWFNLSKHAIKRWTREQFVWMMNWNGNAKRLSWSEIYYSIIVNWGTSWEASYHYSIIVNWGTSWEASYHYYIIVNWGTSWEASYHYYIIVNWSTSWEASYHYSIIVNWGTSWEASYQPASRQGMKSEHHYWYGKDKEGNIHGLFKVQLPLGSPFI
jgi:hypothetical protein